MKLTVKVRPNSKVEKIVELEGGVLEVYVSAPAGEGKANAAVIKAVAKHYDVAPSLVRILRGHKAKNKVMEVV